ncbi:MAG TPA: phosphoribosylformylglycinamidine synthase subunit PurQ [Alphaproteobacteria bacterium]|nr:phosphoribosylformylglycinamidine synthase subunit PurQ [Alphaproteobacteria bacterium]
MKAAVIVFPASNCDRDAIDALERATGRKPAVVWHRETELPDLDLIVVPGGFSYGDYLRAGAMAATSPIMREVKARADQGVAVLGICNGFQVLTEAGMLPGALMRNASLKFVHGLTPLRVEGTNSIFTARYRPGEVIDFTVAHHDGNYFADPDTLKRVEDNGQVAFRYLDNPNGSMNDIAGLYNERRNVLGMMPHPERVSDPALGPADGKRLFDGLVEALS